MLFSMMCHPSPLSWTGCMIGHSTGGARFTSSLSLLYPSFRHRVLRYIEFVIASQPSPYSTLLASGTSPHNKKITPRNSTQNGETMIEDECQARPSFITNLMGDARRPELRTPEEETIYPLDPWTGKTIPLRVWYASVNRPICAPKQPWRPHACGKVG